VRLRQRIFILRYEDKEDALAYSERGDSDLGTS
jgi:hypothetical protein